MVYLKEANYEDLEKEWQYIAAMPEDENGLTNQWPGISREDFEKSAMPDIIDHSKGLNMPDEEDRLKTASAVFLTPFNRTRATSGSTQVAETFLFLWDDDTIVGLFRLRQYLNDTLREGAICRKCYKNPFGFLFNAFAIQQHWLWNWKSISFLKMSFICG